VSTPNYDDWTIDRWRLEPRLGGFEWDDPADAIDAPALWKDLALASVVALVLWLLAVTIFG
jgi:hypothetical protein